MSKPTKLGYSLHLKATEAINEFLAIIQEEDFQYLQEILLEAKKCFGSRQVQHELLPKTPCMKRSKRKRNPVTSESEENVDPSSPQAEVKSRSTRNNKKQKITESSPATNSVLEPVNENADLETSVQATGRKTRSRTCKVTRSSTRQQPTRATRSSRRKIVNVPEEKNENLSELEKVPEEDEVEKLSKTKRPTRTVTSQKPGTPQKVSEPELCEPEQKISEGREMTVSEQKPESWKKRKITHTPLEETEKPGQICVPDTPEAITPETLLSSDKSCKSVLNIVLSPLVIKDSLEKENNGLLRTEQETPSELKGNSSKETEVITSCQRTLTRVSGRVESSTECSSKKKSRISAGSKGKRNNKRKSSVEMDVVDGNSQLQPEESGGGIKRDSFTVSTTTPGLGDIPTVAVKLPEVEKTTKDNVYSEQIEGSTSSQESQPVSSTVKSPEKTKRRSSRWVRKSLKSSTRRRSHILASSNVAASGKKAQRSKTLVKSSVKLKLTQSRLMPALRIPTVDSISPDDTDITSGCSTHFDDVQQDLFGASAKSTANKKSSGSSDDLKMKKNVEKSCQSSESSDSTNRNKSDDDDDDDDDKVQGPSSQSSNSQSESDERSPSSTSSDKYSTPKSRRSSYEDADEVFEDAREMVTRPEPLVTTHPALRRSGESKATVMLTKVQVKSSNIATIHSFIKRNTPKKVKPEDKKRKLQIQIKQKEEREKEIKEKLEQQKQKELEERKRKREEKEKRAAAMRAAKAKIEQEKKRQMEEKMKQLKDVDEKVKKKKEVEEEAKRKVRDRRKADLEARRKHEEEARKQKILDLAEEQKKQQELQRRKQEFEEEERRKKIAEAKKLQELRELELERERQMEKQRILNEIEEKERRQRDVQERQEKEQKIREEKEKERLERERKNREEKETKLREEREEHERKRLAQLFKEKEEQERREREKKWKMEKEKLEKERKLREEAISEKKRQEEERERVLEEKRKAEETKRKALLSADSYEMTPPPVKVRKPASAENYDINDLNSDDSTDDEDAPRKKIPAWAQGPALKATLLNQEYMKIDTDLIFGSVAATPDLHEIFKVKRKRFYQRTSSAIWHSPPMRPGTYV